MKRLGFITLALAAAAAMAILPVATSLAFASPLEPPAMQGRKVPRKWSGAKAPELVETTVNGVKRSYYLYIPAKAALPAPVVFLFHGGGGNAWSVDYHVGGMAKLADEKAFVLVCPEGTDHQWNDGREVEGRTKGDDVAFIDQVIDNLVSKKVADSSRIYSCGISNGGFFSQYLAQKLKGKITAVASVAASVSEVMAASSMSREPIMFVLGDNDPLVPFKGGRVGGKLIRKSRGSVIPFDSAIETYRSANSAGSLTLQKQLPDLAPADACRASVMRYGAEGDPAEVLVYKIDGGGHTWPQGLQYLPAALVGPVCQDFNCNEAIWSFFSTHRKQ